MAGHAAMAIGDTATLERAMTTMPPWLTDNVVSCTWSRLHLHLQTQFGEDRCTRNFFRVIVVTDTARPPQTHKHTDRTDYNTLRR